MIENLFKKPARYNFWMNIYPDMAFTRCPQCETLTKVKKLPLVIDVTTSKKHAVFNLNMSTKYCPKCDLIIAKAQEIEFFVEKTFNEKITIDKCFVFGTIDDKDLQDLKNRTAHSSKLFDFVYPFIETLDFTIQPAGWYLEDK